MEALTDPAGVAEAALPCPTAVDLAPQIFDDLATAEPLWRAMEAEGIGSPYQRFDWARAYVDALAGAAGFEPRVVVFRNAASRPVMLLPLAVERRRGVRIASILGGKQANIHLPLLAPRAPRLRGEEAAALLKTAGRQLGIDVFVFINLPRVWKGEVNPLVLPCAQPNPSNAYRLTLDPTAERTFKRALTREFRRNLRKKERYLAALGPVTHRAADSQAEVEGVLEAFFKQKSMRLQAIGLPNEFDSAAVRAFMRQGCLIGLDTGRPAIELHALAVGERIVATFGIAGDDQRGCGMFNSYDSAPEIARCSPGDLLVARVIAAQCERGRSVFDLGVGEARYKASFCDGVDELFTTILPVTARGRLDAGVLRRLVALKRGVKQTRWAWRTIGTLRARLAKLRV